MYIGAAWLAANHELREHIMRRLAKEGPLPGTAFDDRAAVPWESSGWSPGRNVEPMLKSL